MDGLTIGNTTAHAIQVKVVMARLFRTGKPFSG
jgi:hypothetical protein